MANKTFNEVAKFADESLGIAQEQDPEDWRKKPRQTATPEEQAERAATGRTQGKKGCKAPRMVISLTSENLEFLKVCSGLLFGSKTMTHLVNICIEKYRKENEEIFKKALAMRDSLKE